jgi:hypothetical protein
MIPDANEIIGEYRFGCKKNRSTVDHMFNIRQKYLKELRIQ